ncbi:hypothetical protein A1O1_07031 [Capronia coronata CBS 617.96]|uniref:Glycosyl hydrolase family 32 N-terminal domain-containing protein n=1 Tax=Capronia coronata CBS 617.96 TaxID=1182541 RepID=W9XT79_9EURO|nr:uncharacterized protein A1O1_07031 [Capronia coronata CBS 617.96]EXJ83408.1 hypothetical protein A1O1_07031 [Capronia coronata CBS 617.96]
MMRLSDWTSVVLFVCFHIISSSHVPSADTLPFNISKSTPEGDPNYIAPIFPILPFRKYHHNPVLTPNPAHDWESAYVYNPAAIVLNETIFLLYRAQNASKTSSIGLAWSVDGYNFTRLNEPVLYATLPWEAGGGTEDPRIVRVNGTFYLTYTAYDLNVPRLCIATSDDLLHWTKVPPLFQGSDNVHVADNGTRVSRFDHTKSGAIITEQTSDGLYHMYFGDSVFYHSTSSDLVNWSTSSEPFATPMNPWENGLIEPGPAPIKTRDGRWLLIYNGMTTGEAGYRPTQYSVGQMLLDPSASLRPAHNNDNDNDNQNHARKHFRHPDPEDQSVLFAPHSNHRRPATDRPLARLETPFMVPSTPEEESGQVDLVVFAEGLVQFRGKWFLYYGQADKTIGVAVADVQQ